MSRVCDLFVRDKRGVIGDLVVNFVAFILIFILLISFAVLASTYKEFSSVSVEDAIQKEDSLGILDGIGYMENYEKLVEARSKMDEIGLSEALGEVSYGEE